MYIVYDRDQREVRYSDGTIGGPGVDNPFYFLEGKICLILLESIVSSDDGIVSAKFRPTWLVRVSDMQVVPGSEVDDHYWTLSYSWSQSGEMIERSDGEYDRIDESKHKIVTYERHIAITKTKVKSKWWSHRQRATELQKTPLIMNVNFERIIQRICKDFDIKYIWYDQMCIDQDDHDAKVREIRQMHLIYKNSRCTLALIPELEVTADLGYRANVDIIPESQWSKRIWTLEEAYMSKSILFVGRNVHIWSKRVSTVFSSKTKACTALWFARTRTSSKAHDRIFALVNIFPELQDRITFSYRQSLLDLMVNFYGLLAESDISIMLFGAPIDSDADDDIMAARQREARLLPSWTGANGVHIPQNQFESDSSKVQYLCKVAGGSMYLSSRFILARIETADSVERPDFLDNPIISSFYTEDGLPRRFGGGKCIAEYGAMWCLTFVTTTSASEDDYNRRTKEYGLQATHFLPLREEDDKDVNTLLKPNLNGGFLSLTEDCSDCIILSDLSFHGETYRCHPVLKRDNDCFKSIGVCLLEKNLSCNFHENPKQSFLVR
ncbi:hypothetical protein BJV82DRAFT_74164 [Fennellomyces sp. T-0311]|nr:hypothetical protein BJV82DRAFT_74164 [Fennellomyces sp. T-0311]